MRSTIPLAAALAGACLVGCAHDVEREEASGLLEPVAAQPTGARAYRLPTADGQVREIAVDPAEWQGRTGYPLGGDESAALPVVLDAVAAEAIALKAALAADDRAAVASSQRRLRALSARLGELERVADARADVRYQPSIPMAPAHADPSPAGAVR